MSIIIDSKLTFDEALLGKDIPDEILSSLALFAIPYYSFDGKLHQGQLVVRHDLQSEVTEIFQTLFDLRFPIEKMVPICKYNWDDETSMQDNNTSAFNYRTILGTDRLSKHALGIAIDINPKLNPAVSESGLVQPKGAVYNTSREGTILADGDVVSLFKSFNWKWGGDWKDDKDWQHFEKI